MIPKEPGPTGNCISLLPEVGEITPLGRGYPVTHIPEKFWLLSNGQKPSCSPELSSVDCLLKSGELEFPLDLTLLRLSTIQPLLQGLTGVCCRGMIKVTWVQQ